MMSHNYHLRKRDKVNTCLCNRCFSQKCYVYEIMISKIQTEYAYFKAFVEHKRRNTELSQILQEEASDNAHGALSDYAYCGIPTTIEHEDWKVVEELKKYLISNDFKFKYLDTIEIQHITF